MEQDIQSQFDRAEELLRELEVSCNHDLQAQAVSYKTKNLTQEVLTKVRQLLDQSIYRFFEKHYLTNLSDDDAKRARVYFPIVSNSGDLKAVFGRAKMGNLEMHCQGLYNLISSVQPYNQGYRWLRDLGRYSNDKHIRLTPQLINRENETWFGNAIHVGRGVANITMANCTIDGIPVNSKDISIEPLENFDRRLNTRRTTWESILFENSDVDVLRLCSKSLKEVKVIINQVLEFV